VSARLIPDHLTREQWDKMIVECVTYRGCSPFTSSAPIYVVWVYVSPVPHKIIELIQIRADRRLHAELKLLPLLLPCFLVCQ